MSTNILRLEMLKDDEKVLSRESARVGIGLDLEIDWSLDSFRRDGSMSRQFRLVVATCVLDFRNGRQILLGVDVGNVELSSRNGSSKYLDLDFLAGWDGEGLRRVSSK
jgi:hypothetical protein